MPIFVLIVIEGFAYLGERYLVKKGIIYEPPSLSLGEKDTLPADPLLGWPSPELIGKGDYDSSGSRIIPSFPDPDANACVSAYGDSFTWGHGVSNDLAWSNVLSKILNCRVSNFGVSAYGTDQAYLRFKDNHRDQAKIVLLGYLSENLVRNVNQYFNLLYRVNRSLALKPRFILTADGSLKLIPPPTVTRENYHVMAQNLESFLSHDYLAPGGPAGTSKGGFPYTLSLFRVRNNYRLKAVMEGKPFWSDFYRRDHPSKALEITTLIVKSFYRDAQSMGRTLVVIIFPWTPDLIEFQKNKTWIYQALLDNLRDEGIEALNVGDGLVNYLKQRDPCELFTKCNGGHFNQNGNALVAKLIGEYLKEKHVFQTFRVKSEVRSH